MPSLLPPIRETGAPPRARRRPQAPLPTVLPGKFFVLAYERDRDTYVLVVDDADASNYNMGSDVPTLMRHFRTWGLPDIGNRAIDAAREFGVVQVIPAEDRVIRVPVPVDPEADSVATRLRALEAQEQERGYVHLP